MRYTLWVALAGVLAACGDGLGGDVTGGGPTVGLQAELVFMAEDELEGMASVLVVPGAGVPASAVLPGTCPSVSSTTDSDGDGVPDDATYSFANPPCSASGFQHGTLTLGGSLRIEDLSGMDATSLKASMVGLGWTFVDSAGVRSFTAVRSGTLTRSGTAGAASLLVDLTTSRLRPNRSPALTELSGTLGFTASVNGTLDVGQPLPEGDLDLAGTIRWIRSTEDYTVTASTVVPLHYDPTCGLTPRRITSGQLNLAGTVRGESGTLVLSWTACGEDPHFVWIPDLIP